jgi:hypothetical protein
MRKLPVTDAEIVGRTTWYQQTVPLLEKCLEEEDLEIRSRKWQKPKSNKGADKEGDRTAKNSCCVATIRAMSTPIRRTFVRRDTQR